MATTTAHRPQTEAKYIAWGPLIWLGALHVGALLAFVPAYFSWSGLFLCVLLHWLTGSIGITMTYHRLLTHRSFATRPKALEYLFTMIGCCASEGGAIGWVADHRRHHAHSDMEQDAHTPHEGFGWAHMFWFLTPEISSRHTPDYYTKWTPDLCRDKVHVFLDKIHLLFPIAMLVGLYLAGGMSWLVWGGFVRMVLVLHATWLVNSATHLWGYRTHKTTDDSTNLWWVAIVTYGEGWHNNHHAYPTSARHGHAWWEVDMTYMAIRTLTFLGLAHSIKAPKLDRRIDKPQRESADAAGADVSSRGDDRELATADAVGAGVSHQGDQHELATAAN